VQLGGGVQVQFTPYGWRTARSAHAGGVNLIYADGSLQFIADAIDMEVWRAISTIGGNEVVGSP
jgi:prepilin-type processing-associated H-X9-DG protein